MRFLTTALLFTSLILCASARVATAQETVHLASLSGRVVDASNAAVAGAAVTLRQVETNLTSKATTDRDGRFRFTYLRAGQYELVVSREGFATRTRALELAVGSALELPIRLAVGPVESTLTVSAESGVLDTARSQIAATVSQAEVRSLPMNGRNFLDIALLIPGVSPTNVGGGTQLFPETSAVPGVGLSVASQRNLSNNFLVDGLSANDDAAALSGMPYGVDAIEQFQVVTSGGQAELGRALGGYISVLTKSGTNLRRGDIYYFVRDDAFNAVNALSGQKLPMHQNQYGFGYGGPIRMDRTFFFGNVEQRRLDQSGLVTIANANVPIINARLAATGYPGPPVTTGVYENPIYTTNVMSKIDHQVNERSRLSVRYSLYDALSRNARGAGALNAPSASAGLDNTDHTIAAGHVMTLGSRFVMETRGQFAHSDLKALPSDPVGPSVAISGIASFGTLSSSPTGRLNQMYEVVNNISYQAGAHALRAGVDVVYNDLDITFPRAVRGAYSFSSLANFLTGAYSNSGFTQTFGTTAVHQTNPNVGIYAQDEWKVAPGFTVNAGVRYDLQWLETIQTDSNNVAPRVGVVWAPGASQRTVIRVSGGIFYDRVPLRALANALLSAGNTTDLNSLQQTAVSLSPTQSGAPVFPAILTAVVPTVTLVNFTTMDRNLQNVYSRQGSVEFERQLNSRMTMSVGYEHLTGVNLIMAINQNVPTCVASGNNNGCRPNPTYANNSQYSSAGSSVYDGLHVSIVRRPSSWGSYRVSYTFSKSMNNLGEAFFSSPIDPADLSKDWGRSDDDQRHRLMFLGTLNSPATPATNGWQHLTHGFQVSGSVQYYSVLPFNITSGVNTIQGTPGRPIVNGEFIERNAGEGGPFSTVSLRVSRQFPVGKRLRLEGLVEVFNLFNRRNDLARVTVFGTGAYPTNPAPNFGQITVVGEPRTLQFGLRATF